jgi:hypothetical protein
MNIEISPSANYTKVIDELNKTDGVTKVINKGILVKTDPFSDERKSLIEDRLTILDENFKSFSVDKTGEIDINFTSGYNPHQAIKKLSDWLMYTGGINLRYSLIQVEITVKSGKVDEITEYLHSNAVVVSSVHGSVQDAISDTENIMLDDKGVILISGIIGVLVALISIYYDNISNSIKDCIDKLKNRSDDDFSETEDDFEGENSFDNIKNKINFTNIKKKFKRNKSNNEDEFDDYEFDDDD